MSWCFKSHVFQNPVSNSEKACSPPTPLPLPSISLVNPNCFYCCLKRRHICLANSLLVCSLKPLVWGMCLEEIWERHLLHSEPECHLSWVQHLFSLSTILEEEKLQQEERMRMESRRQVTVSWDSGGSDEAPPKVVKMSLPCISFILKWHNCFAPLTG